MVSMGTSLIEVTTVRVLRHYNLRLTFSDGKIGDVDLSDLRGRPNLFAALANPGYFAQVRVDPEIGTIAWPNALDLAPEVLYDEAKPPGPIVYVDTNALALRMHELGDGIARLLRAPWTPWGIFVRVHGRRSDSAGVCHAGGCHRCAPSQPGNRPLVVPREGYHRAAHGETHHAGRSR
jgi:hypothetical protein